MHTIGKSVVLLLRSLFAFKSSACEMVVLTPLAKSTIVLSWLFVGLACASTVTMLIWSYMRRIKFRISDGCVCAAFVVGILLISLTTWAMVDEGGAKHQQDLSQHQLALVAKVRRKTLRLLDLLTLRSL